MLAMMRQQVLPFREVGQVEDHRRQAPGVIHPIVAGTLWQEPQLSGLSPHFYAGLIWASDIQLSLVRSVNTAGVLCLEHSVAFQEPISILRSILAPLSWWEQGGRAISISRMERG